MYENDRWLKNKCTGFLRKVGVKKSDIIFDCCCGEGNYTIPAARISGSNGIVYAMEMNRNKLHTLREKFKSEGLKNIKIMEREFNESVPLHDESVDIILLYDIFWYFSTGDMRLASLLNESQRILKDDGIVSVYPQHIDLGILKQTILDAGFKLDKGISETIIHEDRLQKGYIWNFKKHRNGSKIKSRD